MAVRKVLRMGDPRLWQISTPVTNFHDPDLQLLIDDMLDTMRSLDGAGLAAPQVGVLKRVVIFGVEANPRYPHAEPVPTTVLINPIIEPCSDTMIEDWEGCLSVPGLRGPVLRYTHIRYSGMDAQGTPYTREVHGFHARVVQHECDHLDGILYPLRVQDLRRFGFREEILELAPPTEPHPSG